MAANDNPSIVNDASGNNYGGIGLGGDSMQEAQLAYLDNLSQLAQHAAPKNQGVGDIAPGYSTDIQAGTISSKTLGAVPLFATGAGILPWGMYDNMQSVKAQAQAERLKLIKTEVDKPLFDQKLVLADPFKQPAFSTKVQKTVDTYLDAYAARFGGDMSKAYIATRNDKNFRRTMQAYGEYADMFKQVWDQAAQIEKDRQDPNKYVSDDQISAVDK
ncbi:MAG: hypothetical protein NT034_03060, partial [Candidatus Magasanikbacteria bacterium]|nr:hypothetical protein [Candidatus Magasanikbacteria bacterium]